MAATGRDGSKKASGNQQATGFAEGLTFAGRDGSTGNQKPGKTSGQTQKATGTADDLTLIHGIGPATEKFLHGNGILRLEQIASMSLSLIHI